MSPKDARQPESSQELTEDQLESVAGGATASNEPGTLKEIVSTSTETEKLVGSTKWSNIVLKRG